MTEEDWSLLRTRLDCMGMAALEQVVADGTPAEVAGPRIAQFNDMLMTKMRERFGS